MRGYVQHRACAALDKLHSAAIYLRAEFDAKWPRDKAKANLDARALIFNCANAILKENGQGISRAEVDKARAAQRTQG
jgi:hypothetical protein